jgi:hypothetical protein
LYRNLDPTVLQSKTVRYIIEVLDSVNDNNQMLCKNSEKTNLKIEYIMREYRKAERVRLNKIGRPLNNEKATEIRKAIQSKRDYNVL